MAQAILFRAMRMLFGRFLIQFFQMMMYAVGIITGKMDALVMGAPLKIPPIVVATSILPQRVFMAPVYTLAEHAKLILFYGKRN
jgi:hypothetical protein